MGGGRVASTSCGVWGVVRARCSEPAASFAMMLVCLQWALVCGHTCGVWCADYKVHSEGEGSKVFLRTLGIPRGIR